MRVFFLTLEWTALRRFVRRQVQFPEGMPSVYLPWLQFKKRGYDVHILMLGDFDKPDIIDFQGCLIHLVPRLKILRHRRLGFVLDKFRWLADSIIMYTNVSALSNKVGLPDVLYLCRYEMVPTVWALAKRYKSFFVQRRFGTWLYFLWHSSPTFKQRINCILELLRWVWPSDLLIVTNDGTNGAKVARKLRIPEERYRVWFNGVDKTWSRNACKAEALRANLGLNGDDFVLMCLSRLDGWKRQDRVINAMPRILEKVPQAKLIIAGDGPKRQELEEMVRELSLESYVQFTGMIEHNKVRDMLGIADVFLQTNDLSCLGNTLLEAMICEHTIVTWDVGTTRDVIIDGQTGCLMPNAEPETIAETVIALANDPIKREILARGARKFAEEQLQSWDDRLDMEIDLIENLYSGKKQRY
jgi:glycosyltransferase involved in cell wall biosynthesis